MIKCFFISLLLICVLNLTSIFTMKCCMNSQCTTIKNCSKEVSHCIFTGQVNPSKINNKFVNAVEMNLSHFECWMWAHESNLCPINIGDCYSVHNHSNYKTFCCAGDLCNNPQNLSCEIKKQNISMSKEMFAFPGSTRSTPSQNSNHFVSIYIAIAVFVFMSFVVLVLARGMWKKMKLSMRRAFTKRDTTTYNGGLSLLSDHTTCLSKVTSDNFSLNQQHSFSEELLKASNYYGKCEKKCLGKFGEIWSGKYLLSDRHDESVVENVAVKIFRPRDESSWETEIDMYRHIRNRCPRILRYIGCDKIIRNGEVEELWIVTKYIECGSLHDYLNCPTNRRPNWSQVLGVCLDIAGGLCYLHEDGSYQTKPHICGKPSIAHRDLKSRNILIGPDWKACIADLGLAVSFHGNRSLSDLHLQVGTQRYMAPEVLEGAINFSRDSFLGIDVYAMALIMWEVFGQCVDFEGLAEPKSNEPPVYLQPFEQELGPQITMENLQAWVVNDNKRPQFPSQYSGFADGQSLWRTIVECWDRDAEARLSSSCVYERLLALYQKRTVQCPTGLRLTGSVPMDSSGCATSAISPDRDSDPLLL